MIFLKFLQQFRHFFLGFVLVILGLAFIYRGALFDGQILFPSNLLAAFYSPWSTQKFPGWEQGIPNKPIGGNDQVRLFYPGRTLTNDQLSLGKLPTWNPYIFSGSPHLANFQSAVFYPLNLLYLVLPQITVWSLLTLAPYMLGFIGMYLYLRQLKLSAFASHIGAISFAFSGFLVTWTQENAAAGQSALWLPFVLWAIDLLIQRRKTVYLVLVALFLACSFLAGFYQVTFYIYSLTAVYALWRILQQKEKRWQLILLFTLGILLSFGLSAMQLLPSLEAFFESPRGSSSIWYLFEQYLLPWPHFVKAAVPDLIGNPGAYNYYGKGFYHETIFYVGIVPLLFALFAAIFWRSRREIRFFTFVAIITYFLTIKSPITEWFFSLPIPLVSTFLPSRILYIASFALSVLSAHGLNAYFERDDREAKKRMLFSGMVLGVVFVFVLVCLAIFHFLQGDFAKSLSDAVFYVKNTPNIGGIKITLKNMVLPGGLLLLTLISGLFLKRKFGLLVIFLLTLFGQLYFLNKYAVLGFPEFLYPEHFIFSYLKEQTTDQSRFLAFGKPILGNVAVDKQLFTPEGIDAVFPKRYGQLAYAAKHEGRLSDDIDRVEVTLSELTEPESLTHNTQRLNLISFLGIKHLFFYLEKPLTEKDLVEKFPAPLFTLLWQRDGWFAYENAQAFPRAFLVDDYVVRKNEQEIVDAFFSPDVDLRKTVILEEELSGVELTSDSGKAEIIEYQPDTVTIKTESASPKILVLSDNYYPGWEAKIDGQAAKVLRANYTFRAVFVPAGTHEVTFYYQSTFLELGKSVSIASIVVVLFLLVRSSFGKGKFKIKK